MTSVKTESTCPHTAELSITAGLKSQNAASREALALSAVFSSPYLYTNTPIAKSHSTAGIKAARLKAALKKSQSNQERSIPTTYKKYM
jgi:hypothetical protein